MLRKVLLQKDGYTNIFLKKRDFLDSIIYVRTNYFIYL